MVLDFTLVSFSGGIDCACVVHDHHQADVINFDISDNFIKFNSKSDTFSAIMSKTDQVLQIEPGNELRFRGMRDEFLN